MNDITKEPTDECCGKKPVELTLEEAIAHVEECINDTPCGQMHKQLADWLKELKDYRCFPNRKQRQRLHMSEQAANEKKLEQCTGDAIAWLGLDIDMEIKEIADWLDALVESGGCGFGSGDAFGASSNSLATWVSSLADKIRKTDSARPLRNCDVGTAEEQVQRFKEYCESNMQYYRDMFGTHEGADGWDCREDCPIGKMIDKNDSLCDHCELVWAQMPYEPKGEANAIQ